MKVLQFMSTAFRRKSSPTSGRSGSPSSSTANNEVTSPSRKRRATLTMKKKNSTLSCSTAEETSSHSVASCNTSDAPWRVERIRNTAPGEADWWKESSLDSTASTEDETVQLSSSGVSGASMDDSVAPEEGSGTTGSCSSGSSGPKVFHNCGLETWEAARAAWTAKPEGNEKRASFTSGRGQTPPSRKDLAKILTKASSLRTYELPRRIPLTNLVDSYVSVWNGTDEL